MYFIKFSSMSQEGGDFLGKSYSFRPPCLTAIATPSCRPLAPLPLLTIRRFSIVCKCAKLKAIKRATEPETQFLKGNFSRSSRTPHTLCYVYIFAHIFN